MKLTMWNLYDYLEAYLPEAHIKESDMCLRSARILYGDITLKKSTVYLANMETYFGDEAEHSGVICVHEKDYILLKDQELDVIFDEVLNCFEFYNDWFDGCEDMIGEGCTLQELLQYSQPVFKNVLMLTDAGHKVLCAAKAEQSEFVPKERKKAFQYLDNVLETGFMPVGDILQARNMPVIYDLSSRPYFVMIEKLGLSVLLCNISHNNLIWGYLSESFYYREPSKGDACLLENLGKLVEMWVACNGGAKQETDHYISLFHLLLERKNIEAEVRFRGYAEALGWDQACNKYLLQIGNARNDTSIYSATARQLNGMGGCLSCVYDDRLYLLVHSLKLSEKNTISRIRGILRDSHCYAVVSPQFSEYGSLAEMRRLLRIAEQYCEGVSGELMDCSGHVLRYMMEILKEHCDPVLRHPALKILDTYDKANRTELYRTLHCYLTNERNYDRTAEQMFIHRNTVKYRIERVVELTGIDLGEPEQRMLLLLSYALG